MSADVHEERPAATDEVIQYEVDGRRRDDLAEPAGGQELRQLGLLTELGAALERAEDDDDVRVVLIRGRGNTFCAGADLNMLDSEFLGTTNNSVKIAQVSARTFDRAFNLAKPTIAVVEGYAVAGGFELMISCDFCIVADDAKIGDFHIRRALFGGAGPDLPPAALHRPAQDQGAAVHRQAAVRQGVRGVGPGQRLGAGRRSSTRRSPTSSRR